MKNGFFVWLLVILLPPAFCAANEEDDYLQNAKTKCAALLAEWRNAGVEHTNELRGNLIHAAVEAEQPEVVEEVAAGGDVANLEIKLPADFRRIEAEILHRFNEVPNIPYGDRMDCVIRRMTRTCFEVWTPQHGWLFDGKGQLVNEATVPRRDGIGREWHGAFLPDGSWVTTDLWEMDKTLTFFSRHGKWMKEMKAAELAPRGTDEKGIDLIGWARCDRNGEGYVASIGSEGGRAIVFVKPNGKVHLLEDASAPWRLCYPRDLEPKGMYTSLSRPSDDFKTQILFSEPAHGPWVGFPTYRWSKNENEETVIPSEDNNFGFLPGSHDVFISASDYDNGDSEKPRKLKTRFFSADGKCRGWLRGSYLADSTDAKAMWFLNEKSGVTILNTSLKPQSSLRFVIANSEVKPVKIFPDLQLGFFKTGKLLVLAKW